ncbi:SDR family NAD(P)-dependent oxidoreductase [Nocardia alba]|uniref:Short-subunit dehydrogenase n=1 Tax=Nocardia alba TaxID=225051 RepID=A0A4R1FSB8_9NOCA|nr:SDR family NAD(P)-dependent oxidoreductase [Nocardia alba]TCJ96379.1 short-subunit dehydrogenase [Nocardia alba]
MARILITGGASGLGAALTRRYTERGDTVLVTDLAEHHPVPDGATYLRLDVTSENDWTRATEVVTERFGGLDVLVNNAGIATGGRVELVSHSEWTRVLDINVAGVANGCRAFVPLFKQARAGHVVNTASLAGLVHPPAMSAYTAAKAAVVALSESLRYELAPHGVAVSVLCPSFFRTNLATSLRGEDPVMAGVARKLIDTAALDADQIAAAALDGIDARRFLVLTDRAGRRAFWSKRLLRPLYDRQMFAMGRRTATTAQRAAKGNTTHR